MLGLLLLSVSVGLSNFAGAIGIGLMGVDARLRLRVGAVFGLFEALMPIAGLLIGRELANSLGDAARYLGAGLLVVTGAYAIWQGRKIEEPEPDLSTRRLFLTALALSIDNLVVGFALGVYRIPIILAAVVIAAVSVGMSLIGLEIGDRLGRRVEAWSEELGGAVLVLVGLALATGVLR